MLFLSDVLTGILVFGFFGVIFSLNTAFVKAQPQFPIYPL